MHAETTQLIRTYYAAFNAKQWDAMLACLTDDVAHHVNEGGVRTGVDAFHDFTAHMERSYDERLEDIVVMTDAEGLHGAAEFVVHGRYLATDPGLPQARGQTYVLPAGAFFDLRGGKISRITTYYNLKAWLAQVS